MPPPPLRLQVEANGQHQTILLGDAREGQRESLAQLLGRHDLPLNTRCGRRSLCDGCTVELIQGRVVHCQDQREVLGNGEPITLRACEYTLLAQPGAVHLRLPERSVLVHQPQVASDFRINVPWANAPLDAEAPGDLGAAIDVGTTTVVVLLVNRRTGEMLGRQSDFNRQLHLGDDVLTRINLCSSDPAMLGQLQAALLDKTLRPLLAQALREAGASPADLGCITVAANSTMLHLLAGVDPSPMGVAPFTPAFLDHRRLDAWTTGIIEQAGRDNPAVARPSVHLLPGAAAYVGADIVAGVFASRMAYDEGPLLLVDAGTNGEIVLKHGDRIWGCATAAGPAFEGAGLTSGTRASTGAISRVHINGGPQVIQTQVIGDARHPIGICGSAYVDLLAEGRRSGLLNPAGRFDADAAERLGLQIKRLPGCGGILRIAKGLGNREVALAEPDVANLLQAKAAIAAGILTLLAQAGLTQDQVKTLYLAGGFGMHMDVANAIACGLLPGFAPEQVELVGNTSLAGAYLALVDRGALEEMKRLARQIEIVELNLDPSFEMTYIEQLSL